MTALMVTSTYKAMGTSMKTTTMTMTTTTTTTATTTTNANVFFSAASFPSDDDDDVDFEADRSLRSFRQRQVDPHEEADERVRREVRVLGVAHHQGKNN